MFNYRQEEIDLKESVCVVMGAQIFFNCTCLLVFFVYEFEFICFLITFADES